MTFVDLRECRCEGRPPGCRHTGLFVDRTGRDLPGMARFVENQDWAQYGRYRPLREILEEDDDELPIEIRW